MLSYLRRRAQSKGLLGGSRGWTAVWVALTGAQVLRRITADKPKVVYSEKLEPGQTLVIRAEPPDSGG